MTDVVSKPTSGFLHGTVSKENIHKLDFFPVPKGEKEEKFLREYKIYEFSNVENPGQSHSFPFGSSSRNATFCFFHGGRYRLPRFLANHMNESGIPQREKYKNLSGHTEERVVGKKPRLNMREVLDY